ncbi:protein kinase [bacterium]|nr:protein kinase [bacterium]
MEGFDKRAVYSVFFSGNDPTCPARRLTNKAACIRHNSVDTQLGYNAFMTSQDLTGRVLSHYRIIKQLGAGGMGEVYLAKDTQLDRTIALKILPAEVAFDQERMHGFVREAKAASAIDHPNIVQVYEISQAEGVNFIAMQYVEGHTLRDKMNDHSLQTDEILQTAIQMTDAMAEAHARGIIHRDLKPANIMISNKGYVKLLDFGLARIEKIPELDELSQVQTWTKTEPGTIAGTIAYMSPEQALGKKIDHRTDIFSIGVVLYEMSTGRRPFFGNNPTETIDKIVHSQPESITRLNYSVPQELERIIRKCMEKDPGRRYQSVSDILIDLKNLQRDLNSSKIKFQAPDSGVVSRKRNIGLAIALLLVATMAGLILRERFLVTGNRIHIKSIAVLPLENLPRNPNEEYFADGMTEALITDLAKIGSLKVISRTSVMRYKGINKPMREIAEELNVDALVEGSVFRAENQIRITAQLIDAETDEHIWAESYEGDATNILKLQREVASAIARQIKVQLTPEEKHRLGETTAINLQAYEAYLKGQFYRAKSSEEGFNTAIDYFQKAIELEPQYPASYAGLAAVYGMIGNYGFRPPKNVYPKAKEIAQKALKVDPNLAETHNVLGYINANFDWDWLGAETEFKRAIELNPNLAVAYDSYSYFLLVQNRIDESFIMRKKALELDPISLSINTNMGSSLRSAGRLDESVIQLRKTIQMDPNFYRAYVWLGQTYDVQGKHQAAINESEKARALSKETPYVLSALGYVYARAGRKEDALEMLKKLTDLSSRRYVSPYDIALVYAGLGDKDEAFSWLEKAYQERATWLIVLNYDQQWDPLRNDDRFSNLLHRMNFSSSRQIPKE